MSYVFSNMDCTSKHHVNLYIFIHMFQIYFIRKEQEKFMAVSFIFEPYCLQLYRYTFQKNMKKVVNDTPIPNSIPEPSQNPNTANEEPDSTKFTEMFRFAKKRDIIYISIGTFCSIIVGGVFPFFSYLWGNMTDAFTNLDEMVRLALNIFVQYSSFGVGAIFAGWGMQYFWTVAGERQANQCRKAYIEALMKQEVGWFETQNTAQIISKFVTDTEALQLAIGEKVSLMIYLFSMFLSGFIVAMTQGWELALVITAFLPAMVYSWEIMERFDHRKAAFQDAIFQKANSMAAETINSIKIVKQFNGEEHQQKRFQAQIDEVKQRSFEFNIKFTLAESLSLFCYLFAFALAFWYGSQCIQGTSNCPQRSHNPYTGGTIVTIFFCLTIPAMNLHQLAPSLKVISEGRIAAARIFKIIDRVPLVKSPEQPVTIENLKGIFRFQEVSFAYPKDKTRPVLTGINMALDCRRAGIMGQSGSGKSTLLQLMMRLYDPDGGVVTLDGVDIRQLNLRWLRSQIAYVGQEPLLFSASIRDNLYVGRPQATDQELTRALSEAEMLQFVAGLSQGVDTFVGIGGSQLSGGQKQRIAIARAFIKDPHFLLFDEATSALDRRNERFIQSTLNRVAAGKISITIAHRPQTILGCDQIYFIDQGKLTKQGCPEQFPIVIESMKSIESEKFLSKRDIVNYETAHIIPEQRAKVLSAQALNSHKRQDAKETIASATNLVNDEPDVEVVKPVDKLYSRLFGHTKDDKCVAFLIILGVIGSLMHGLVMPSMGIYVGRVLAYNLLYPTNPDHYRVLVKWECLYMLLTCFAGALVKGLQFITFLHLGTGVVNNIRKEAYGKVLRLPLSWFQCEQNHAEQVPAKIGTQIYKMKHIITSYVPHLSVAMGSIVSGLLLAFYFQWRTALVAIGLIPLIGVSAIFQYSFITGYMNQSKKLYEQSTKIITETLTNFKTVLSFCHQEEIIAKYSKILDEIQDRQFVKKLISGLIFGISFFTLFFVYGLTFYLAALFIRDNRLEITNSFCAVLLVLFSGIVAGNNAKNIPDLSMLKVTAEKLFSIIDLQDEDEIQRKKGSKLIKREIKGNIAFKDVKFKYENREEIALKGISFEIKQGEKVGLVGESGCGKSTILKLLLAFYSCQQGKILIDGESIEDYDIHCLREHFGTVSQQPDLFDETVQYNIVYNAEGIEAEQIEEAAQKAELHSGEDKQQQSERAAFFKRKVGPRGTHLSGGQKQRVAIARVILKNPNVLLLDEATSALDKQNEQKVQNCLNAMMKGRTTLSVTHKLDTLTNASHILVFKKGELVEEGKYESLIEKKSQFYRIQIGLEE